MPDLFEARPLMMTWDESLVVPCFLRVCSWAGLMPTSWTAIPTSLDVVDLTRVHFEKAHKELKIDWDDMVKQGANATVAMVVIIRSEAIADRDDRCIHSVVWEGNEKTDGMVKYVLRQHSVEMHDGNVEEFDDWWKGVATHGKFAWESWQEESKKSDEGVALIEDWMKQQLDDED